VSAYRLGTYIQRNGPQNWGLGAMLTNLPLNKISALISSEVKKRFV
jgi:hypothetical protein